METIIKHFINYLFDIGFVGIKTIKTFMKCYENNKHTIIKSNKLDTKEKLKLLLIDFNIECIESHIEKYYVKLNKYNPINPNFTLLNHVCDDIINKYFENSRIDLLKKLKLTFKYYKANETNLLSKYFSKFKERTLFSKKLPTESIKSNYLTSINKVTSVRNSSSPFKNTYIPCKININGNRRVLSKKEEDDIKNCTFTPNANMKKRSRSYANVNFNEHKEEIFYRLHYNYKSQNEKKELERIRQLELENNKFNRNKGKSIFNKTSVDDFYLRQSNYEKNTKEKITELQKFEEEKKLFECTFKPKLITNQNKCEMEVDRYERLYKNGKNKILKKNKSYDSRSFFNSNSINNSSVNLNVNNTAEKKRPHSNRHRSVNINKLNYLYKDYKKKDIRAKEIREKMEKDEGISFKPTSYTTNSNVKVKSTFRERNLSSNRTKNESSMDLNNIKQENSSRISNKTEEIANIRNAVMKKFYSTKNFSSKESSNSLPVLIKLNETTFKNTIETKKSYYKNTIPINKNNITTENNSQELNSLNNTIIRTCSKEEPIKSDHQVIKPKEITDWSYINYNKEPQTDRARNVNLNLPKQTSLSSNDSVHRNTVQAVSKNLNKFKKNFSAGPLVNC